MSDNLLNKRLRKNWNRRATIHTLSKGFTYKDCEILESDEKYVYIKDNVKNTKRIIIIDDIEGLEFYGDESE